jgi:hypothetical protein
LVLRQATPRSLEAYYFFWIAALRLATTDITDLNAFG